MCDSGKEIHGKDELGALDHQGSTDRTVQSRKSSSQDAVFCLIRVTVWPRIQEMGRVGKGWFSFSVDTFLRSGAQF